MGGNREKIKSRYKIEEEEEATFFFLLFLRIFFKGVDCLSTVLVLFYYYFLNLTGGVGQDGLKSSAIDCRYKSGPSLLGIVLERVVNVGLRHREDDSIDNVDDAVRGLNVWAYHARSINCDHLLLLHA